MTASTATHAAHSRPAGGAIRNTRPPAAPTPHHSARPARDRPQRQPQHDRHERQPQVARDHRRQERRRRRQGRHRAAVEGPGVDRRHVEPVAVGVGGPPQRGRRQEQADAPGGGPPAVADLHRQQPDAGAGTGQAEPLHRPHRALGPARQRPCDPGHQRMEQPRVAVRLAGIDPARGGGPALELVDPAQVPEQVAARGLQRAQRQRQLRGAQQQPGHAARDERGDRRPRRPQGRSQRQADGRRRQRQPGRGQGAAQQADAEGTGHHRRPGQGADGQRPDREPLGRRPVAGQRAAGHPDPGQEGQQHDRSGGVGGHQHARLPASPAAGFQLASAW